jgi:hypothetical protein
MATCSSECDSFHNPLADIACQLRIPIEKIRRVRHHCGSNIPNILVISKLFDSQQLVRGVAAIQFFVAPGQ